MGAQGGRTPSTPRTWSTIRVGTRKVEVKNLGHKSKGQSEGPTNGPSGVSSENVSWTFDTEFHN